MRRLLTITTLVLVLLLTPAWAQMRGGGRVSGGGHGGFVGRGGFGGHIGSGHAFGGGRSFGRGHTFGGMHRGPSFAGRGLNRRPFLHQSFRGPFLSNRGFRHHRRFRDFDFDFDDCFGCRRFWGWPSWWAWEPWWWDSGSSYDADQEREIAAAREMNRQSLEEQRMRREEDQDSYARSDPQPQPREAESPAAPSPATVLVFRDQHQQEVQNYAIVGQTLWSFGPPTQKIPLSDLDLEATTKANDDRGVDFHLPGESQGQ